jgi:hypothetical protein
MQVRQDRFQVERFEVAVMGLIEQDKQSHDFTHSQRQWMLPGAIFAGVDPFLFHTRILPCCSSFD